MRRRFLVLLVFFLKALPGKERVGFHGFVDATAHGVDNVLVCRCVEHGFNHFCNFVHEVFLGTAGGDGGSSEANSGSLESTAGVKGHCALSQVVTMVRLMLMYYVDFIAFMENPEKTWNDFLAKEMQKAPPEPSLFD